MLRHDYRHFAVSNGEVVEIVESMMQLLVQCVGAGVVLGLVASTISIGLSYVMRYLHTVFKP